MKAIIFFYSWLIICSFMACNPNTKINNVELTDFAKELIYMYINDPDNLDSKKRKDEIIITSFADTLYYHHSVFANNSKAYKFCREDFVGQVMHQGHLIRLFGDESSIIINVNGETKKQKRCNDKHIEYDPNVWRVSCRKDKSFCKMRSYKTSPKEDISAIQSLAEKYFEISYIYGNEVFRLNEVENEPKFFYGEDYLRNLISSNFSVRKEGNWGRIPIVVDILVDKKGKASLRGVLKSSSDGELDTEALRVVEIICQYDFIPGSHRGINVNVILPIVFFDNDILP